MFQLRTLSPHAQVQVIKRPACREKFLFGARIEYPKWRRRAVCLLGILAGIQTAAVMSVGTATIAAFIGAGGYGERIAVGLALNDNDMLLAGAIPAALFALATQGLFEVVEWALLRRRQAEANR
jgi:hypothetical protein